MESIYNYNLNRNNSMPSDRPYSTVDSKQTIEKSELISALEEWGNGLLSISNAFVKQEDYTSLAKKVLKKSYAFQEGEVLFKPTLASFKPFRTTFESALSYFIGGNEQYPEDRGFALNPWSKVNFEIAGIIITEKQGIIMGNKILKQVNGNTTIANFTMGFIKNQNGELKINLHHSSLPYSPT